MRCRDIFGALSRFAAILSASRSPLITGHRMPKPDSPRWPAHTFTRRKATADFGRGRGLLSYFMMFDGLLPSTWPQPAKFSISFKYQYAPMASPEKMPDFAISRQVRCRHFSIFPLILDGVTRDDGLRTMRCIEFPRYYFPRRLHAAARCAAYDARRLITLMLAGEPRKRRFIY